MKKILFYTFLFIPVISFGQISQGKVSCALDFSTVGYLDEVSSEGTSLNLQDESYFSVNPSLSYFFTDKMSLGGAVNYEKDVVKTPNSDDYTETDQNTSTTMKIGPSLGYYNMIGDRFGIFVRGTFSYVTATMEKSTSGASTTVKYEGTGLSINLLPGFIYFLHNKFAFEAYMAGIEYSKISLEPSGGGSIKETLTRTGVTLKMSNISLGMVYYFK
jgi:hypothetical protein